MKKLNEILSRVFDLNEDKINDNISKENTEEWDSFNHLLLISEIEKSLGINFSISEVEEIKDYKILKQLIKEKGKNLD